MPTQTPLTPPGRGDTPYMRALGEELRPTAIEVTFLLDLGCCEPSPLALQE